MEPGDDILGQALEDYHFKGNSGKLIIHSPDFEDDDMAVSWYFRKFGEMPELEQYALSLCRGRVLDAGAGAGSHSLFLQEQGLDVTAMDSSPGACRVMKDRGVKKVVQGDIFTSIDKKYDTMLMLMNGIGITSTLDGLDRFLDYLPGYLEEGGQLVFDSSNLIYLFQDRDGVAEINLAGTYYGEIEFRMEYLKQRGPFFRWLYVDFDLISEMCEDRGFRIEFLQKGDNLQYLARILP